MKLQTLGILFAMTILTGVGLYITTIGRAFLLAINGVTFSVYGIDKWSAIRGKRRTPEATLHLLALFGGSPGAAIAQSMFRHKTSKLPFRRIFFAIIAIQLVAIAIWTYLIYR